ncbi:MAG: HAD-IIIA family hydrolase [Bacteroidia bacterium]
MGKSVLILDRDGVINRCLPPYTYSLGQWEFLPDAETYIPLLARAGYDIYLLTNQGGIAKGIYTWEETQRLHHQALGPLKEYLRGIFICPHHALHGACLCRKPYTLFYERALALSRAHAAESYVVGDHPRDLYGGFALGMKTIYFSELPWTYWMQEWEPPEDLILPDTANLQPTWQIHTWEALYKLLRR